MFKVRNIHVRNHKFSVCENAEMKFQIFDVYKK